ncbi:hypothetical protein OAG26_00975 [Flavobacteriales bacterium]|nr:hypothetical protein [Flavobacteriales bacterium]
MATFSSFLDILPDPTNPIGISGQALATGSGGTNGPGFASVEFSSEAPIQVSRTNSGRVLTRAIAGHKWKIQISYNPMTRDQFEPVYNFLLEKNGRLNPFFVKLPQQANSRNAAFTSANATITTATTAAAGAGFLLQAGHNTTEATQPQPGDMFTITDSNDSLHTKAYRVTRVLSNATYQSGGTQPSTSQRLVYFTPHLQRAVAQGATCDYTPLIRVMQTADVQQYSLGTNNLFSFSLSLEECQA